MEDLKLIKILKLVNKHIPKNPQRILDVGCQGGKYLYAINKILRAKELYGINLEPVENTSINMTIMDVNKKNLPYLDKYFDFIFCGDLIEIVHQDNFYSELRRILTDNGFLILATPNLCWWLNRIVVLLGFQPYYSKLSTQYAAIGKLGLRPYKDNPLWDFPHYHCLYSFKQFSKLYGLRIIKTYGAMRGNSLPEYLFILDNIFSYVPSLAAELIFICKKQ